MKRLDYDPLRNRRVLVLAVVYAAVMTMAYYLAFEVRFDFLVPPLFQNERLETIGWAISLKLLALVLTRQLGSVLSYFSIPDLWRLVVAMSSASAVLTLFRLLQWEPLALPRGVLLIDYMLSLAALCALRMGARLYRERFSRDRRVAAGVQFRIAIMGAGDAGAALAHDFVTHPGRGFKPVLFFDDDPAKRGKQIHGIRVAGPPEMIAKLAVDYSLSRIVIAMPTATAKRIQEVVRLATEAGLKVEILPSMVELASGRVRASRIRPVEVLDLLGREAVNLNTGAIRDFITGKVVMVTGAGGSIGAELCRQIVALNPDRLLLVEQSEGALFLVERHLNETGLGAVGVPLVADILDHDRMEQIFQRYKPAIVFHAAAHKHVYMMERQPAEAIRNNSIGTRNLARMAGAHGVESFILISTDKAINPTNVMGASKRLAELQLQEMPATLPTKFLAVRFGNVLGSSGSVIPIFKEQIEKGGPVTVTHPEVTRYFMTIPEAVGLVLQSAVLGEGREIFVLDMGKPVKIVDLARQMIELSGYIPDEDIEIQFTGLKPGEKLYEELQHRTETHQPTRHPQIMRFVAPRDTLPAVDLLPALEPRLRQMEAMELKKELCSLVPEYTPFLD